MGILRAHVRAFIVYHATSNLLIILLVTTSVRLPTEHPELAANLTARKSVTLTMLG